MYTFVHMRSCMCVHVCVHQMHPMSGGISITCTRVCETYLKLDINVECVLWS